MSLSPEEMYYNQLRDTANAGSCNVYDSNYNKPLAQSLIKPQVLMEYKLLLKNESKLNKELINFFKKNLQNLNKNGLIFDWIIVYNDELEIYADEGISKFPMMITENSDKIIGKTKIIQTLVSAVHNNNNPTKTTNKSKKKNPAKSVQSADDMKGYMMNELNRNDDTEVDDNEVATNDLTRRASIMNEARRNNRMHVGNASSPEIYDNRKSKSVTFADDNDIEENTSRVSPNDAELSVSELMRKNMKTDDDRLMANFWENQGM